MCSEPRIPQGGKGPGLHRARFRANAKGNGIPIILIYEGLRRMEAEKIPDCNIKTL